jgi:TRAP-type C4-dicarboxylate transport system permease small subunit
MVHKEIRRIAAIPAKTIKIIHQISRISGIVAISFLVVMMITTVVDVTGRFLFRAPIFGSLELTEDFMVLAGFLGIAWCAANRGHVRVDWIVNRMPPRPQATLEGFNTLLSLIVIFVAAWQSFVQALDRYSEQTVSDLLKIPDYPFYLITAFGFFLTFLVLLIQFIRFSIKAVKG